MTLHRHVHHSLRLGGVLLFTISLIIAMVPSGFVGAADPNKLFISPSSSQMNTGTSFTVNVKSYAATVQTPGSVSGSVTYPTNLLQVTSISTAGSNYGAPSVSQGSGTITFNGSTQTQTSTAQIFAITFQTVGAGTATVGFGNGSTVNNSTTSYVNGSFTITSPPSAPPAPKVSASPAPAPVVTTPADTSAPAATDAPQPTPDPAGVVDSVVVDPLYASGAVTWKINADKPSVTFTYGTSAGQLDQSAKPTQSADGTFSTTLDGLNPGVLYFFSISATGGGGKNGTYTGTLLTRGYPVELTVTQNNSPIQSGNVIIGNYRASIDGNGKASIGLPSGSYSGTITSNNASLAINLTVAHKTIPADGSAPELQKFSYNLTGAAAQQSSSGSGFSVFGFIGALIGGLALTSVGFVGFMGYRRRKIERGGYGDEPAATVIVDDGFDWQGAKTIPAEPTPPADKETHSLNALELPAASPHHNSVYITEEEPLDMFEQAAKMPLPSKLEHPPSADQSHAAGQNPNLPHSTTP